MTALKLTLAIGVATLPFAARSAPVDFTREVQPILAEHCTHCHGSDEGSRKGGLRLDVRNFTFGKSADIITLNENAAHPCPVLPEAWKSFWRIGEWNEVRARITGDPPTITTWVNGVRIMQHTEPQSVHPARGHIGLQVHGGVMFGGTVHYRNIRLRRL